MQRVLKFDGKTEVSERRYVMMQIGFIQGGALCLDPRGTPKSIDAYKREIRILDQIEALGTVDKENPVYGFKDGRQLAGAGEIVLDQTDFELLERYVKAFPWGPDAARAVVDLHEWMGSADKQEG